VAGIEEKLLTDVKHKRDFVREAGGGDLEIISGFDNIKEAIMRRIITEPGSLMHRPTYGVGLKQFQNAPLTVPTKQELAKRINKQLPLDVRVASVESVSFEGDDRQPDTVKLIVSVNLVGFDEAQSVEIPFGEVF